MMAALDEFDQTMTMDENVKGDTPVKQRSGIFGLVAISCSLLVIIVSLFSSFFGNSELKQDVDYKIHITLVLSSKTFLSSNSEAVCDGQGDLKGINTSVVKISSSSLNESLKIGSGTLNNQGACIYNLSFLPPSNFGGGYITIMAVFPFGSSSDFKFNLGTEAPWDPARVSIPLD